MGGSVSLPEKVLAAAQKNDYCGFMALVADCGPAGLRDPAARAHVLEHRDSNGRTPLLICAAKNHLQLLQQLIALGANVHYMNPQRNSCGSALHEAAARRNEGAVQLLLAAGACPFTANANGRTALDEAVLSGHAGVVRAMERCAEFTGLVAFKTRSMAGLSAKYKERWAVLFPYLPYPSSRDTAAASSAPGHTGSAASFAASPEVLAAGGRGSSASKPRRCLWLYKDAQSISPRCRLWVDGACITTHGPAGTEGTLRLHTSHGEPVGDLHTRFESGHCVSLRPTDLTPAATATFHRLVALINHPAPPQQQQQQANRPQGGEARLSPQPLPRPAVAAGILGTHHSMPSPPPPPPPPRMMTTPTVLPPAHYPAVPPVALFNGQSYSTNPPAPPPYPGAAGPCPMASPLSLYRPCTLSPVAGPSAFYGGGIPGAAQPSQRPGPSPRRTAAEPPTSFPVIEHMAALHGETDEEFAARLASAISVTSGRSQEHLYPQQSPQQQQQQQQGRLQGSSTPEPLEAAAAGPAVGNLIHLHPDPSPFAPCSPAGPAGGPLDQLDIGAVNQLIAAQAAAARADGGKQELPSAPPPPPPEEDDSCIICMNGPKEVGFLHGDCVHRCVCRGCSSRVAVGDPCPLCRRTVERVLGVY